MRIEAGGDQDQLRAEGIDERQHLVFPDIAEAQSIAARWQQQVVDIADAALVDAARMRIQPGLVGAQVLHGGVAFEDRLGAVTVMDVEIHDGDALQPMPVARMGGGHGDVVEQAKSHRHLCGGVVTGRTHGAEGGAGLVLHHRIDGGDTGAGGAQGGRARGRHHARIHVQLTIAVEGGFQYRIHLLALVHAAQVAQLGQRRFAPVQIRECAAQGLDHRFQAGGAFRVLRAGVVTEAGGMCKDQHGATLASAPTRAHAQPRRRSCRHRTSCRPSARASTRASTNSRSDKRLR